jgi:hypothetical protein
MTDAELDALLLMIGWILVGLVVYGVGVGAWFWRDDR